jgi:hypothetical protein
MRKQNTERGRLSLKVTGTEFFMPINTIFGKNFYQRPNEFLLERISMGARLSNRSARSARV